MMKNTQRRRQMRQRRDGILRREPIVMLDIGSSKIAAMIVQYMQQGTSENIAYGFRVLASGIRKSDGVDFGEASNLMTLQGDLMRLLQSVQRTANVKVNYAMVTFAGGRPYSYGTTGEVSVENGEVSQNDIGRALLACEIPIIEGHREFLHMMPINFTLDDKTGLGDPRGLVGARLAADMHLLSIDSGSCLAIEQAIRGLDLEILGTTVSGFATGLGVLTEDEMKRGCVVIDFGAMTTSVAVFCANQLMFARNIRLGGQHVTNDIAQAFGISIDRAEKLKTKFGGIEATAQDDRDMLDISGDDASYDARHVTRSELIGVIRPRVEEIFEAIVEVLADSGVESFIYDRYIISGGAAQMAGMDELAERFLNKRVRIGRPLKLSGAAVQQESLAYSAISGLALYTAKPKDELWDFADPTSEGALFSFRSIFEWFRQNW